MRRLTSAFAHVLPTVAALGLLATAPALAQTPPPSPRAGVMPAPTPPRQGPQPDQGQQAPQPGQGQQMTPPATAPRPEPRAPSISSQGNLPLGPVNIKLDLAVTDNFSGTPIKKSVSLLLLNGYNGMIRTTSYADGNAVLNVDAIASAYQNGQVSLRMTFEYVPARPKENPNTGRPPTLNESITVVLQDGKPLMVSQSADPATDRKVTAELTATILK